MTNQRHIYLERPDITERRTRIIAVRPLGATFALALEDNLHRAAGGGEPPDRGAVRIDDGDAWQVIRIEKVDGRTWLVLDAEGVDPPAVDTPVTVVVDAQFRTAKRRLHTLEHIAAATVLRQLSGVVIEKTAIDDDAHSATILAHTTTPITPGRMEEIDRAIRGAVLDARPVYFTKATSVETARKTYGSLFRVNERYAFSGKVRLVIIDGIDVNPCSGCHYDSSGVGPYRLTADLSRSGRLHISLEPTRDWTYWFGDRASAS